MLGAFAAPPLKEIKPSRRLATARIIVTKS
jgi:hypothetical protein